LAESELEAEAGGLARKPAGLGARVVPHASDPTERCDPGGAL